METIICPKCHALSEVQRQRLGTLVRCSRCRATIVAAPELPEPESEELAMVDEDDSGVHPAPSRHLPIGVFAIAGGFLAIVVASVALVSVVLLQRTQKSGAEQTRQPSSQAAIETVAATKPAKPRRKVVIFEAHQVIALYQNNEVEADGLLKGEQIDVQGEVVHIGKDPNGSRYVLLCNREFRFQLSAKIKCLFKTKHDSQLASLNTGDRCRVRGRCEGKRYSGKYDDVILKDCELIPQSLLRSEKLAAAARIRVLTTAVQTYLMTEARYPESLEALSRPTPRGGKALLEPKDLIDPWGERYQYDIRGPRNPVGRQPDIWTVSPDGEVIGNWL